MPTIDEQGRVTPQPGDIIFTGPDGQLWVRAPTKWERVKFALEYPVRFLVSLGLAILRALYHMVKP